MIVVQTDMEQVHENQERMASQLHTLRQRVKLLNQQNQRIEGMLQALMTAQDLHVSEEDHHEDELFS